MGIPNGLKVQACVDKEERKVKTTWEKINAMKTLLLRRIKLEGLEGAQVDVALWAVSLSRMEFNDDDIAQFLADLAATLDTAFQESEIEDARIYLQFELESMPKERHLKIPLLELLMDLCAELGMSDPLRDGEDDDEMEIDDLPPKDKLLVSTERLNRSLGLLEALDDERWTEREKATPKKELSPEEREKRRDAMVGKVKELLARRYVENRDFAVVDKVSDALKSKSRIVIVKNKLDADPARAVVGLSRRLRVVTVGGDADDLCYGYLLRFHEETWELFKPFDLDVDRLLRRVLAMVSTGNDSDTQGKVGVGAATAWKWVETLLGETTGDEDDLPSADAVLLEMILNHYDRKKAVLSFLFQYFAPVEVHSDGMTLLNVLDVLRTANVDDVAGKIDKFIRDSSEFAAVWKLWEPFFTKKAEYTALRGTKTYDKEAWAVKHSALKLLTDKTNDADSALASVLFQALNYVGDTKAKISFARRITEVVVACRENNVSVTTALKTKDVREFAATRLSKDDFHYLRSCIDQFPGQVAEKLAKFQFCSDQFKCQRISSLEYVTQTAATKPFGTLITAAKGFTRLNLSHAANFVAEAYDYLRQPEVSPDDLPLRLVNVGGKDVLRFVRRNADDDHGGEVRRLRDMAKLFKVEPSGIVKLISYHVLTEKKTDDVAQAMDDAGINDITEDEMRKWLVENRPNAADEVDGDPTLKVMFDAIRDVLDPPELSAVSHLLLNIRENSRRPTGLIRFHAEGHLALFRDLSDERNQLWLLKEQLRCLFDPLTRNDSGKSTMETRIQTLGRGIARAVLRDKKPSNDVIRAMDDAGINDITEDEMRKWLVENRPNAADEVDGDPTLKVMFDAIRDVLDPKELAAVSHLLLNIRENSRRPTGLIRFHAEGHLALFRDPSDTTTNQLWLLKEQLRCLFDPLTRNDSGKSTMETRIRTLGRGIARAVLTEKKTDDVAQAMDDAGINDFTEDEIRQWLIAKRPTAADEVDGDPTLKVMLDAIRDVLDSKELAAVSNLLLSIHENPQLPTGVIRFCANGHLALFRDPSDTTTNQLRLMKEQLRCLFDPLTRNDSGRSMEIRINTLGRGIARAVLRKTKPSNDVARAMTMVGLDSKWTKEEVKRWQDENRTNNNQEKAKATRVRKKAEQAAEAAKIAAQPKKRRTTKVPARFGS